MKMSSSPFLSALGIVALIGCGGGTTKKKRDASGGEEMGGSGGSSSTPKGGSGGSSSTPTGGTGGMRMGTGGTAGSAGGTAGSAGGSTGNADAARPADASGDAPRAADATAPRDGVAGMHTAPACGMVNKSPNPDPTAKGTAECDNIGASLDFEPDVGRKSGMPMADILMGTGFGDDEVNQCRPYCYTHNFAIGLDMKGGDAMSQMNEVLMPFDKPVMFNGNAFFLIWFFFDAVKEPANFGGFRAKAFLYNDKKEKLYIGDDMYLTDSRFPPAFTPTRANTKPPLKSGGYYELKNGGVGFAGGANVVGIGLQVTAAMPLAAGDEWHGRLYIDHARYGNSSP
jgi:hypothetical protein